MGVIANKIRQAIYGIDVREDIAQGIEAVESLREEFDIQVISAGNSNSEIVAARIGEVSLPAKIVKIVDSIGAIATQSYITDKVKTTELNDALTIRDTKIASLSGGGPKNTFATLALLQANATANTVDGKKYTYVVTGDGKWYFWNGSIWTPGGTYQSVGINNLTVGNNKLNLPVKNILPETFEFVLGYLTNGALVTSTTRVITELMTVTKGSTIHLKDTVNTKFVLYKYTGTTGFTVWGTENVTFDVDTQIRIIQAYTDNRVISTSEYDMFGDNLYLTSDSNAVSKNEADIKYATKLSLTEMNTYMPERTTFQLGSVSFGNIIAHTTRAITPNILKMEAGTKITIVDSVNTNFTLNKYSDLAGTTNLGLGSWVTEDVTFAVDTYVRILQRYTDDRVITDLTVLKENVHISTQNTLATKRDVANIASKAMVAPTYVTLLGDDDNDGYSYSDGLKTLQKAISNGAKKIYVERGIYYGQTVNASVEDLEILPYGFDETWDSQTHIPNQKCEFRGSKKLDNSLWVAHNSIYKQPYAGNTMFTDVFITKVKAATTGGSRPSFNAIMWEGNDKVTDYKLTPVLTLAACEASVGTFFYDGTNVFVNPTSITKEFNIEEMMFGLNLDNSGSLKMVDIVFDFYHDTVFEVNRIKNIELIGCEANHNGTHDGFSLDYSNGNLYNCYGQKNRNDGFNFHYRGSTNLYNCSGLYNYDDGASHHEGCIGTFYGGKWIGNGKGGIAPAYGAKVNWYNCLLKNNLYGIYHDQHTGVESISSGNLYIGNGTAILNTNAALLSIGDKFSGNGVMYEGNVAVTTY